MTDKNKRGLNPFVLGASVFAAGLFADKIVKSISIDNVRKAVGVCVDLHWYLTHSTKETPFEKPQKDEEEPVFLPAPGFSAEDAVAVPPPPPAVSRGTTAPIVRYAPQDELDDEELLERLKRGQSVIPVPTNHWEM